MGIVNSEKLLTTTRYIDNVLALRREPLLDFMRTDQPEIIQQNEVLMGGQTIRLRSRLLCYALIRNMDSIDPTKEIIIDAQAFKNWVNDATKDKWSDIHALVEDIFKDFSNNPILVKNRRGQYKEGYTWFNHIKLKDGFIKAQFNPSIVHRFSHREEGNYTKLLWDIRSYKSSHTARVVELFQRHHDKRREVSEFSFQSPTSDLKFFFGVHEKYERFYDFNRYVLKAAMKELQKNARAPYYFHYQTVKEGRSIVAIDFRVFIRSDIILQLIPKLRQASSSSGQMSLFQKGDLTITSEGMIILDRLNKLNIKEDFQYSVLAKLSYYQAVGYCFLVEYGVNFATALDLVGRRASHEALHLYEDQYIRFVLERIEKNRLARIKEHGSGKHQRRITPIEKRGGLVPEILENNTYLPEFLDHLQALGRKKRIDPKPLYAK